MVARRPPGAAALPGRPVSPRGERNPFRPAQPSGDLRADQALADNPACAFDARRGGWLARAASCRRETVAEPSNPTTARRPETSAAVALAPEHELVGQRCAWRRRG